MEAALECGALPLFSCTSSDAASPASRGLISRLLSASDPLPARYTSGCVQLLGHKMVMCTAFSDHTPFLLLQQHLNDMAGKWEEGVGRDQLERRLRGCVEWLLCLECYTHRYIVLRVPSGDTSGATELAKTLVAHLSLLVGDLDPLETTLSMLSHRTVQQTCSGHMTRLSLHVHWTVLCVMFRMIPHLGVSSFLRQARHTMAALLSHAASSWNSLSLQPEGVASLMRGEVTLWPCDCVRELWLLLRCSLDRAATTTCTPFWALVSTLLHPTLSASTSSSSSSSSLSSSTSLSLPSTDEQADDIAEVSPSNSVAFSWWCICQLSQLYGFSEEGRQLASQESQCHPNWEYIHHLLPHTFHRGASEQQLRLCLWHCLTLSRVWPPSLLPVTAAWDYFYRHMDDPFVASARRTLQDWASPEGSAPRQWLEYLLSLFHSVEVKSHSHSAAEPRPLEDCNSFELFLCLVAIVTEEDPERGRKGLWRQLKGRFYSKLHRRWLEERKGAGLRRVLSLLLTLAWGGDSREVALKTVSILSPLGLGDLQEETPLLWRAVLAQLLLLVERGADLEEVLCKLQPPLTSLARPHPPESRDVTLLWDSVGVVLDGTQELLESAKGISLGAGKLIGSHLSDLLTSAEGGHLTRLLQFVESLCTILTPPPPPPLPPPPPPTPSLAAACCSLWQHCSQALLSLTKHPLPPSPLPSTLAALTAFAFLQEVTRDTVSPGLACGYLAHVIANDIIRHHMLSAEPAQLQVLHTWLRGVAQLGHTPSPAVAVQQLSTHLPELPLVSSLLGNQTTPTEPLAMLRKLLRAMESAHGSEEGGRWRERLQIILGDLPHHLEPSVSGGMGHEPVRHAYRVAATVVSTAPRLTYSKTDSRCLLPRLVDWLALPLSSSQKPLPEGTAASIRSQLHHFLSGLLQLEPRRDDFIRRKLKQIFSRYFHQYTQPHSPLMQARPNPFLLAVEPWLQPGLQQDASDHLVLVLEIIAAQCLALPQQPTTLSPTLQFIKVVVERVQSPPVLVAATPPLLGHMTSCLLACDMCPPSTEPAGVRRLVMSILSPLLKACRDYQHLLPCASLLPTLRDFVASNLKSSQAAVVKPLMSLADLYPELVEGMVPVVRGCVEEVEEGRGEDISLRAACHALQLRLTKPN